MRAFNQFDRKGFRKLAALAGIVIIAAFAMIQAVHIHPDAGLADNAHCALCPLAHAFPAVILPTICPALIFVSVGLLLFEPPLRDSVFLYPHYSRPPPQMA
jgi:hypothetical protein